MKGMICCRCFGPTGSWSPTTRKPTGARKSSERGKNKVKRTILAQRDKGLNGGKSVSIREIRPLQKNDNSALSRMSTIMTNTAFFQVSIWNCAGCMLEGD